MYRRGYSRETAGTGATDTILDVGCGTGNAAIAAAHRGARVTGLDIVPTMLDETSENATIADVETIEHFFDASQNAVRLKY